MAKQRNLILNKKDIRKPGSVLVTPSMTNTGEKNYVRTTSSLVGLQDKNLLPVEKQASDEFVNWYSDPATKQKFQKNTGLDPLRTQDFIGKGLRTPIVKYDESVVHAAPLGSSSEAEFRSPYAIKSMGDTIHPKTGYIAYRPQADNNYTSGLLNHELTHASGFDNVLAPALYRSLGLKLPEKTHGGLSYMNRPEEVYGNFHEFRQQLGLRPGQKVDVNSLNKMVKESKIDNNFWRSFSSDETGKENQEKISKIVNAINTVASVKNNNQEMNYAAFGGEINNGLNPKYNNYLNNDMKQYAQGGDLTRFDEGGTHESSPLGGIPQGMSPDGKQNTVEQGESKKGNFIYSNRIALDKDLVKQFNLPGYVAGKSVSDASKAIDDKFKDRSDKYAQETKKTLLDRLAGAQEYLKQQEQAELGQTNESMMANSQEIPDQMNGQIPEGMEEYAEGMNSNPQEEQMEQMQGLNPASPIAAFGGYQQKRFEVGGNLTASMEKPWMSNNNNVSSMYDTGNFGAGQSQSENKNASFGSNANGIASNVGLAAGAIGTSIYNQDQKKNADINSINAVGASVGGDAGKYTQAATGVYDMAQEAFGKSSIETSGKRSQQGANVGKAAGSGALKGASTGAAMGSVIPGVGTVIGAGVGAIVGGITGFVGGKKDVAAQNKNNKNYAYNYNSQFDKWSAYGGELNNNKPIKATPSQIADTAVVPSANIGNGDVISRYVNITGYQPGVTEGSRGRHGSYIMSPELTGGREFVDDSGLARLHASPQWNTYQTNMKAQIAAEQAAGLPVSSYSNLNKGYALGGNMNQYVKGGGAKIASVGTINPIDTLVPYVNESPVAGLLPDQINQAYQPNFYNKMKGYGIQASEDFGKFAGENAGDAMRLAPVAMNAYQLAKLKKPQGFQYQTLGNRYKPQYVDEAQMQRNVDQAGNNTMAALTQMGGSQGATRNAILAMGLNKTKGLSDAYANAASQNRAQDAQAQQFNLNVDASNASTNNKAIDEMRADQGAYDSAKSKYLSSIGTDIGDIGKEKNASDAAIAMFGYTRKGKYVVDKNGNRVSPEMLARRQSDFATYISEQNKKANV